MLKNSILAWASEKYGKDLRSISLNATSNTFEIRLKSGGIVNVKTDGAGGFNEVAPPGGSDDPFSPHYRGSDFS